MLEAMLLSAQVGVAIPENTGPAGQMQWTVPGTYQWTVPEGIYSVCGVVISAGPFNNWRAGVYGGSLRYRNSYLVTPGEKLTIVVGAGTSGGVTRSAALDMFADIGANATPFSTEVKGGNGATAYGAPNHNNGGNAGSYTNGTGDPGRPASSSGFIGAYGTSLLGSAIARVPYIAGVGGACGGSGGFGGYNGGNGGVRLIWGKGRAYPNTNVADV